MGLLMIGMGAMVIKQEKGGGHGQPPPKTKICRRKIHKEYDDEAHDVT
jgi:hypothetical protein